jgi:hypothetical protein
MIRSLFVPFASLLTVGLQAQTPAEVLERYRTQWRDQPGVFLKLNTTIHVENTPNGVVARRMVERERLALKPPSGQSDREEVGYSELVPLTHIKAWTMVPGEKSYKKVVVKDFTHRDELDNKIFHDDNRNVQFRFPGMAVGAITHLDYGVSYPDARMMMGHYFAHVIPVEQSTLTVIADKGVEVMGRGFHLPEGAVRYEQSTERGRHVQRWTMTNVQPSAFEDNAPGWRYYAPHVQLLVRKPGEPDGHDMDRMYAWNYEHIRHVLQHDNTALVRIAREVTAGLATDREKAKALYTWVQDHIKYVAVEDGMNGVIPAPAATVCRVRYGDCKGMANLLRALMVNAGLKAHLTWVGSRELPYTYDELPSPLTDDHMITAWDHGDGFLLMDPTSNMTPFGMPSSFIQGKQALIAIDERTYKVVEVPIVEADVNTMVDSVHVRLEGTALIGTGTWTFTGYERVNMAHILDATRKDKWHQVMRGVRMKVSNRFQVDSVQVEGLNDRDHSLVVRYWFSIPGIVNASGGEYYLPRLLENSFSRLKVRKDRKLPMEVDYRWTHREVVRIDLPPGMVPGQVPATVTHEGPGFGYTLSCTTSPATAVEPARIILDNHYRMDKLMIAGSDLDAWRTMTDRLELDGNSSIVIKQPGQ